MNHELEPGAVLLLAARGSGSFRASQLGELSLQFFPFEPERMMGFFTVAEQLFFEMAASKDEFIRKFLPAQNSIAAKMRALCATTDRGGPSFRLQLLQLFFEAFGAELKHEAARPDADLDAKERLRGFLQQTTSSELLDISIAELAQTTRCTPRHLSRIFMEVVGVSFRDKQTELRLSRARELLATTKGKIVDVALESGYQSLSLFNLMFSRRFGMSPGRWRQTHGIGRKSSPHNLRKSVLAETR